MQVAYTHKTKNIFKRLLLGLVVGSVLLIGVSPVQTHASIQVIALTSGTSWTVPSDWNSSNNTVECIGGGGTSNYNGTGIGASWGGGGGAYAKSVNLSLTPGASITYQIGAGATAGTGAGGDTWFNSASFPASGQACGAKGGGAGTRSSSSGGSAASSYATGAGSIKYSGGAGGSNTDIASYTSVGGGGGGAGGRNGNGSNGGNGAVLSTYTGGVGGGGDAGFGGVGGIGGIGGSGGTGGDGGYQGTEFDGIRGSGGGGGGSGAVSGQTSGSPGAGGLYGGGGGAGSEANGGLYTTAAPGAQGIIIISYVSTSTSNLILSGSVKFLQSLAVVGSIYKGSGTFVIDDPADPANKLLYHSFVESPDVKNLYDGIATLNKDGEATVKLPAYFEALNKDFRYQFFPLEQAMPNLYIKQEVKDNQFTIAGGTPGGRVSWQVTGVRHDAYILANPVKVEVEKGPGEPVKRGECIFEPLCE